MRRLSLQGEHKISGYIFRIHFQFPKRTYKIMLDLTKFVVTIQKIISYTRRSGLCFFINKLLCVLFRDQNAVCRFCRRKKPQHAVYKKRSEARRASYSAPQGPVSYRFLAKKETLQQKVRYTEVNVC